jgi:hypothetical protein
MVNKTDRHAQSIKKQGGAVEALKKTVEDLQENQVQLHKRIESLEDMVRQLLQSEACAPGHGL